MKTIHALAAGAALLALAPATTLSAQTTTAPEAASGEDGAIIITARRRAEDEQKVPVAVTVVGGDLIRNTYTVNISQLTRLAPTLNYSSPNPRNTAFTIRGLGSSVVSISQANDGLEPGVGFYVDQVYHARPATAAFDFTDLDQVEVLRGPQGTLFGKNTTAGAINITTKKPSFTFGGEGEISVGQQGFRQVKGAVTGPIADGLLAFRLSGALTRRHGVIYNVRSKSYQNDVHNDALRGQLLFTPAPNFSLRVIGDWANFKNECCTQVYVRVAPTLKPAAQQYAALAANLPGGAYTPPSTNPYDRLTSIDAPIGVDTQEGGVSAIADWTIGGATITSVTAWRYWDWDAANDRDYTGIPIQLTQHIPSHQDQISQELRVAGTVGHSLDYVAGVYYLYQKIVGHPISIYTTQATYWLLPAGRPANLLDGYQTNGTTDFRTRSAAVFGEVTWRPFPRVAVTGGLRYTHESKDGIYDVTASGGLATSTASLVNDKNSILRTQFYTAHVSDGSVSGRANASYELTDNVMVYGSYARGQKSGGINMSGLPVYPAGVPGHASGDPVESAAVVKPEKNTTWELGLKSHWLDHALVFNINLFSTKVTDFQANIVDTVAPAALRSYLANIPSVLVKGVEIDSTLRVSDRFSLRASGAYAKGRYGAYTQGPCPIELISSSTQPCDLSGKPMPGLPKWSGSLGGEYDLPMAIGTTQGNLFARADVSARTGFYADATDSAYMAINGYTTVDASIGYRADLWEVAIFARNLFNKNYMQNLTVQAGNSGLIVGTPSDPRLIGLTLRVHR